MRIAAFVFARGGSKGLPGKNLLRIGDKPLVQIAVEQAKASKYINSVAVSTDDIEIGMVGSQAGARVIVRPHDLTTDTSPEWLSWQHAIEHSPPMDIFVSVPCTCPLRSPLDIDATIEKFLENQEAEVALTVTKARPNPYYTAVIQEYGTLCPLAPPPTRRQDAPEAFSIVGVTYVARPSFIRSSHSIWEADCIAHVEVPAQRAIDIDDELDYRIAKSLMEESYA